MFEFHADRKRYFDIQRDNAARYVIPFIEEKYRIQPDMKVLEIGCGEGGVLKAFIDKECTGVGVEMDATRIENANLFLAKEIAAKKIKFIIDDIYRVDVVKEGNGPFDIIILKDVIEHIHDQEKLLGQLQNFLTEDGVIFFGFPPWYMPFGGHQQIAKSRISKLPYIHLLPKRMYKWILTKKKESVAELMEIRETGISIERFEKICKKQSYQLLHKRHYLINPIYQWKFGWKPRKQAGFVRAIPFVRNFFTSCVYYLIQNKKEK